MGKLEKYTSYKDSGFQWLGQIPEHWKLEKIGGLFFERREKVSDKDFEPLSVTKNGILPQLETAVKTDAGDNRKLVRKGDFVVNSRSDRKGSSGLSELDGSVSLINLVLKPLGIKGEYCHYLLRSHSFVEEFYRHGHGIVADLWTTRFWDMKSIMLCIPKDDEQTKIALYLDEKTAQIDNAIRQKEKLIELLKEQKQITINDAVTKGLDKDVEFKNSSVEWIGEVPMHWNIEKGKRLFKQMKRPVREQDEIVTCFRDGVVTLRSNRRTEGFTNALKEHGYQGIRKGDFIIHNMDAFAGAIGISDSDGKSTPVYAVCRPWDDNLVSSEFYAKYLRNLALQDFILSLAKGIRERSTDFRFKDFGELVYPVPPKEEQIQIVKYIETQTVKNDKAIELQQNYITKLKEYKASLIDSVVTGKVKVA